MVFYYNRCATKPSHNAELSSNFVGKTVISSLEDRKSEYLTGICFQCTFICVTLVCLFSDIMMQVKVLERSVFFPTSLYFFNQFIK